ncbi:hypothetical protein D7J76_22255 [Salmonella enterica]|nr:hypothetical protein [Salmonella enterica]
MVFGMAKDLFDVARVPANRVAARVIGKGIDWQPNKKREQGDSETPLPTLEICQMDRTQREQFYLFRGRVFGRMTVIGIAAIKQGDSMRYVVRCACGTYTYRRAKAIKNPKNNMDCCDYCRHLLHLKRNEIHRRTGKNLKWEDLP